MELHPLQNPDILELIFSYASVRNLKVFREVCRAWALASAPSMRKSVKVTVDMEICKHQLSALVELLSAKDSTWLKAPFSSTFEISKGPADNPSFWQLCGSRIKSLRLVWISLQSPDVLIHTIFESCQNLEHLDLVYISFVGKARESEDTVISLSNKKLKSLGLAYVKEDDFSASGVDLIRRVPSSESLHIKGRDSEGDWVFRSLASLRSHQPDLWNLKNISWEFEQLKDPRELLPVLVEGGLKLEAIGFKLSHRATKEEFSVAQEIISAHATTLRKLSVIGCWRSDYVADEVIRLPKLTFFPKLEMLHLNDLRLVRMDFLQLAPNLKALCIHTDKTAQLPEIWEMPIYPNVKELSFCFSDELEETIRTILEQFAKSFPNVEKMDSYRIKNEAFTSVCELWPKLRSLRVESRFLTEPGITGYYDKEDLERIEREGAAPKFWRPITARRAHLSSLKNLESFIWLRTRILDGLQGPPNNSSVLCGVLELPCLRNLSLGTGWDNENKEEELVKIWNKLLAKYTNFTSPSTRDGGQSFLM